MADATAKDLEQDQAIKALQGRINILEARCSTFGLMIDSINRRLDNPARKPTLWERLFG